MTASKKTAKHVSTKSVNGKSAKKTNGKSVKKTAAKKTETKRPEWMGKVGTQGCDVNAAIKLMQRPKGCTRADLNAADFRQPAMSALKVALNRGYKGKAEKKEGEFTIYRVTGSASA